VNPGKQSSPALGKTFSLVALLTFLSKFIGMARDIIVLQAFGAGIVTDAYNYATLLTGNILVLFGGLGGPFHQSTVAVVQPRKESKDVGKLIFQIVSVTALILGVITAVVWLSEPYVVAAIIQRMGHFDLWNLAGTQLQIMLPLVLISGVIGILYGISNVYGEYTWPSLSPALASIAIIIAVLCFKDQLGMCLAWGTLLGAVAQLVAQLPATLPHMRWQLSLKPEPGVKEYTHMLWPAAISTSIGTLTVYVDGFFASSIKLGSEYNGGAWTAIVNSNRLVQLPLGILLTAMLVPILPRFTEQVSENRIDDLKAEFRRGLRILWFLSLPIAGILMALPGPILGLLFQHGHFTEKDTELFSVALIWLVPMIVFYVGRDLITRVFYAYQDSKTPYRVAMAAIVLKAILDWVLVAPLGVGGISLATTLITVFNLTCLGLLLRRKIGNLGTTLLIKPFSIMIAGSIIGSIAAYATYNFIFWHIPRVHVVSLAFAIGVASAVAGIVYDACAIGVASAVAGIMYVGICIGCKLEEPQEVLKRLRKSKA
jgi:putative peptidoglycan lipid II flippase